MIVSYINLKLSRDIPTQYLENSVFFILGTYLKPMNGFTMFDKITHVFPMIAFLIICGLVGNVMITYTTLSNSVII